MTQQARHFDALYVDNKDGGWRVCHDYGDFFFLPERAYDEAAPGRLFSTDLAGDTEELCTCQDWRDAQDHMLYYLAQWDAED